MNEYKTKQKGQTALSLSTSAVSVAVAASGALACARGAIVASRTLHLRMNVHVFNVRVESREYFTRAQITLTHLAAGRSTEEACAH